MHARGRADLRSAADRPVDVLRVSCTCVEARHAPRTQRDERLRLMIKRSWNDNYSVYGAEKCESDRVHWRLISVSQAAIAWLC